MNLDQYLQHIRTKEPDVKAWAFHDPERVKAQLEHLNQHGPLAGIPVGIKDLFDTCDMPTCYGSKAYAGHQPYRDSWVVQRLRSAGAVIMGKTVTTEFAFLHPGPTRNPHNTAHTPGGSSSGSAASVAAGMVPVAIGTQTGGSVIRPSAFCGVIGFKPTHGVIPLDGVMPLAPSLDTVGIHAASIDMVRKVFQELVLRLHPTQSGKRKKLLIGWYPGPNAVHAETQVTKLLEKVRKRLSASGIADVEKFEYDDEMLLILARSNRLIIQYEASRIHQRVYRESRNLLGEATVDMIETGLKIANEEYQQTLQAVRAAHAAFIKASQRFDALLTFSAPGEAPRFEQGTGSSVFNQPWTTLGVPCITLPAGKGSHGLPLAIQLIGNPGQDFHLLNVAQRIQQECLIA